MRLTGDRHAELASVGLAEDRHACRLQTYDGLAVRVGYNVCHEFAAAGRRRSGNSRPEILDQIRDARQRAIRKIACNRRTAVLVKLHNHGVESWITRLAAGNRCLQNLAGGDRTFPNQDREPHRIMIFKFVKRRHRFLPFCMF